MTSKIEEVQEKVKGGILAKNTIWNLVGQGLPLFVSIYTIPRLFKILGDDRFGLLLIAWTTIGYLSLFDLGLGRALTQKVAELLGSDKEMEVAPLSWTSLLLMLALGIFGAIVTAALSHWLVYRALKIPADLLHEAYISFLELSLAIPFVVVTSGLRGILEAKQEFGVINRIRIPLGIFMFIGPLIACMVVKSLVGVIFTLVLARFVAMIVHLWYCLQLLPTLKSGFQIKLSAIKPLLAFGALMTVSNIISPIMVSMDRFLIASQISSKAVSYYATPLEMVTKIWIIPSAIVAVLFPVFSALHRENKKEAESIFDRGSRCVMLLVFPICFVITLFSKEILTRWLGAEFASHSAFVLQWLSIGVFASTLGQVAFSAVQGAGRPDLTTRFHLIQLPFYILLVWVMLTKLGVVGVAIAWTLRVIADTLMLTFATKNLIGSTASVLKILALLGVSLFLAMGVSMLSISLIIKFAGCLFSLTAFGLVSWRDLIQPEEKQWILRRIGNT